MIPDGTSSQSMNSSNTAQMQGDPMEIKNGDSHNISPTKDTVSKDLHNYMNRKSMIISHLNAIKEKAVQIPDTPEMNGAKNKLRRQFQELQEALNHIDQAINFTNELLTLVK